MLDEHMIAQFFQTHPEFEDTGLIGYIVSQLELSRAYYKFGQKTEWRNILEELADIFMIPADFRKTSTKIEEFCHLIRLHLKRKLEVESKCLRVGGRATFGSLGVIIRDILPTFFILIIFTDGEEKELNPNVLQPM